MAICERCDSACMESGNGTANFCDACYPGISRIDRWHEVRADTYQIIGTDTTIGTLVEYHPDFGWDTHSTSAAYDSGDGRQWYAVKSRRLPADLEALPARSRERYDAVRAWYADIRGRCEFTLRLMLDGDWDSDDGDLSQGRWARVIGRLGDLYGARLDAWAESQVEA